jgi:predicted nucleotidyltransferase
MNKNIKSDKILNFLKENRNYLSNRFGIKNIGIFGSFIRNSQNNKSDIDLLVEFNEGQKTFDNYMDLKYYLEDIFIRQIDLCLKNSLRKELKKNILKEVVYG